MAASDDRPLHPNEAWVVREVGSSNYLTKHGTWGTIGTAAEYPDRASAVAAVILDGSPGEPVIVLGDKDLR